VIDGFAVGLSVGVCDDGAYVLANGTATVWDCVLLELLVIAPDETEEEEEEDDKAEEDEDEDEDEDEEETASVTLSTFIPARVFSLP
jgi:hypothetical protein